MRALLIVGLILLLTGGLIATGIVPLKLSTVTGTVLRNTNLWIQGKIAGYGDPVELDYVFQVIGDDTYKFFGGFYRGYNVNRDSYAYKIKYDSSKNGKLRVLVLRMVVDYEWDPDNVEEFSCDHWCGQKWKTDVDGWAQDIVVKIYVAVYRAKLDENDKILYLIEKERDVSYNEFAGSTILVGSVIRDPRIVNTIMLNYGHSSDTYEITLYRKTVLQNGVVVWNQDAPRVYRVVLDCSWKGFHYELWPSKIIWNDEVLWDNLASEPSTTTVWNPIVTTLPDGGEIPSNNTVTTTSLTTTPGVTYTTTQTVIENLTTTTLTSTTVVTSTETVPVNIAKEDNMLYGALMSFAGLALMVLGFRR